MQTGNDKRQNRTEFQKQWQTAGDRIFLYLHCLNLPAVQSAEFLLKALTGAEQKIGDKGTAGDPVAESVSALLELLRQNQSGIPPKDVGNLEKPCIASMPPMRRLHMTSREFRPASLQAFLVSTAGRLKIKSGK